MVSWHIGTMGFGYKWWQGVFYPKGLTGPQQLAYYAERFSAVEMDSTFYATPAAANVERWANITPADFIICPKAPREITHDLRLTGTAASMELFLTTMRLLGKKLGPIVFQFPPDFKADESEALRAFLPQLPEDLRFAVEFRHRSWVTPETADLMRQHRVCWVAADYIYLPKEIVPTTDFLYLRFLGRHGRFANKPAESTVEGTHEAVDRTAELQRWYNQIQANLEQVNAVYAFFNDDFAGFSPGSANRFKRIVGLETVEIGLPQQRKLF
jgi:uncharacterized protein YecE (DUF72 family)